MEDSDGARLGAHGDDRRRAHRDWSGSDGSLRVVRNERCRPSQAAEEAARRRAARTGCRWSTSEEAQDRRRVRR